MPQARLVAKLEPYRRLRRDGGPGYPVLFWLPTTARETNLHARLAGVSPGGIAVATAARDTAAHPARAVWRLVGNGRRRLRLAELPNQPGRPGPYNPGPARTTPARPPPTRTRYASWHSPPAEACDPTAGAVSGGARLGARWARARRATQPASRRHNPTAAPREPNSPARRAFLGRAAGIGASWVATLR
jgi:hypothetical protein